VLLRTTEDSVIVDGGRSRVVVVGKDEGGNNSVLSPNKNAITSSVVAVRVVEVAVLLDETVVVSVTLVDREDESCLVWR
jgi:hypothetical protein